MKKHSVAFTLLLILVVLPSCERGSSEVDERQHREVFAQMYKLRGFIMDYQRNTNRQPTAIKEVVIATDPLRQCHLLDGQSLDWKFNNDKIVDGTDWLVASPLITEHDGVKGVWVITKNLSIMVWSKNKFEKDRIVPQKKSANTS